MRISLAVDVCLILFLVINYGANAQCDGKGGRSRAPCTRKLEKFNKRIVSLPELLALPKDELSRKGVRCESITLAAKLTRIILIVFHVALGIVAIILFCKEQMKIISEQKIVRATKALSKESSITPSTHSILTLAQKQQKPETSEAKRILRQLYRIKSGSTLKGRRENRRSALEKNMASTPPRNNSKDQSKSKESESLSQSANGTVAKKHERSAKHHSQSSEDGSKSSSYLPSKSASKSRSTSSETETNKVASRRSSAGHECIVERDTFGRKRRRLAWDEVEMRRHGLVTRDCMHLAPPAESPPSIAVSEYSRFGHDLNSVSIDFSSIEESLQTARDAPSSSTPSQDDHAVYTPQ